MFRRIIATIGADRGAGFPLDPGDFMHILLKASLAVLLGLVAAGEPFPTAAQEQKKPAEPNPVGAGPNWTGQVSREAVPAPALDEKQMAAVKKVNTYFAELNNLRGTFVQTAPDKKRTRGKFYVKKPGRFRFDYALPSKQVIISDGTFLRIQDFDLNDEQAYELDNTPFRLLLRKDVDLVRDARITDIQESDDLITATVQDKSTDVSGRIKLFLSKKPSVELKEWVTTDAQGLDTHVEVSDLVKTEDLDPKLFKAENMMSRKMQ